MPHHAAQLIRPLLLSILIALALYVAAVAAGDARAVAAALARFTFWDIGLVLALSLVNYLLRFGRWHLYLLRQQIRVPLGSNLLIYVAGFALVTTPAKVGEVIRSGYLKQYHAVGYAQSLAALFADRLLDVAAVLLLALLGSLAFPEYRLVVGAIALLLLITLPLLHSPLLQNFLRHLASRLRRPALRRVAGQLLHLLAAAALLLRGRTLLLGLLLSLIAWFAEGVGFWWICQVLGLELSLSLAIGIYAVAMLAGAASMIPGGLGSTEAVMGVMLYALSGDLSLAVTATLLCRLATLWFAVLLGFAAIARLGVPNISPLCSGVIAPQRGETRSDK